jgi:hypothetical protein
LASAITKGNEIVFMPYSSAYITYITGAGVIDGMGVNANAALPGASSACWFFNLINGFAKPWATSAAGTPSANTMSLVPFNWRHNYRFAQKLTIVLANAPIFVHIVDQAVPANYAGNANNALNNEQDHHLAYFETVLLPFIQPWLLPPDIEYLKYMYGPQ